MGSSGSKPSISCSAPKSSSSSDSFRKARSKGYRSFHSYCLGNTSGSRDSDNEDEIFDHRRFGNEAQTNPTEEDSNQRKLCHGNVQSNKSDEIHCVSSNAGHDEWSQATVSNNASRTDRVSALDASTHSWNPSSRFLSRFSLIPSNVSFRLRRTTSLGSSRSCPISSPSHTMLNSEGELHLHAADRDSFGNIDGNEHNHVYPVCLVNSTPSQCFPNTPANLRLNPVTSGLSDYSINESENSHAQEVVRDRQVNRLQNDANCYYPRVHAETESGDTRHSERLIRTREPVERNVRFSRTLSVGRLRDRVLRRSSLSDFTFCPPQQERDIRNASHSSRRPAQERNISVTQSGAHAVNSPSTAEYTSGASSSLFGIQDYEVETSLSREARYQDILEHRSNFLERRRRIRSQVRALQRLGNRFENLSGHDRSCILSGQHRSGRCTCRLNSREANANDNANDNNSARASISRIVVLAEALFEVLDEIHQQSVVLSSRPSVSSIGSVPAPKEVVESLPIKLYTKLQKHQEEAVQCYICLVEYEDGDSMRVLPCHHEFHRSCVDKWLKEIHRVCPLCRGDICSSGSLPVDN